jgi:hypothetical protein
MLTPYIALWLPHALIPKRKVINAGFHTNIFTAGDAIFVEHQAQIMPVVNNE